MALSYNNSKCSSEIAPGKWQGHLTTTGTADLNEVCADIERATGIHCSLVYAIIATLGLAIVDQLKEGKRVSLPGFRVEPQCSGAFEKLDASWNPEVNKVTVAIIPSAEIREAMSDLIPANEVPQTAVKVLGVQDKEGMTQDVIHPNADFLVEGENLLVGTEATRADGLYLRNKDTLVEYKATITGSTKFEIDAKVPANVPVGRYEVWAKSNNKDDDRVLVSAKYAKEVLVTEAE